MKSTASVEDLLLKNTELSNRLEEAEQLIEAIKQGEVDAFALRRNNKSQIYTLESGDYVYRMLVENFSEGAVNLTHDGLIIYANSYFPKLLGIPYEDVIGKFISGFIHPQSQTTFTQLFKQGLCGQSKGEINLVYNNNTIPVYISFTPIQSSLPMVGMIITDLTEKKKHEETLRQQNKELTHNRNFIVNVLESTDHGVLSYAAIRKNNEIVDFEIRYANENALEHLKLPSHLVIGNTYLNVMPQAKKYGLWDRIVRVLNTGNSEVYEVNPPDAPDRSFLVKYTPLGDGVTCTFIEITQQKERQRELEEKNEILRERNEFVETLLNASMDMVIVFDHETTILQANNKAHELYTSENGENIIGKKLSDIAFEYPTADLHEAFATGKTIVRNPYKSLSGTNFYEVTFIPLFKKGAVYAIMVITHDITESILKKDELEKMNKELESFAYISSHDLQEPLRKIQTFVSRITEIERNSLSAKGLDMFERLRQSANRMQILIDDLLTFSRTKTADRKLENVHLKKIIDEVKEDLKEELKEKNATIQTNELCYARIIPFQFRQLMYNLISNSLKFSKPGVPPCITINSYIRQDLPVSRERLPFEKYCNIAVSDNGIGFEQQYSQKIFELFQRLHEKTEFSGTGIGLSIVKKIVDNHNGIITAQGKPNCGATFDIYIPVT